MQRTSIRRSSVIAALEYRQLADRSEAPGLGLLLVTFRSGSRWCYLAPSWCVALLMSAQARGASVGALYHRIIKARDWQRVPVPAGLA